MEIAAYQSYQHSITESNMWHIHLVLALSLMELPYFVLPWEFCAHRTHRCYLQMGGQRIEAGIHIAHISSAHTHAPLSCQALHTKHKLQGKITKNFKMVITEHWTKHRAIWGQSPVSLHRLCAPTRPAVANMQSQPWTAAWTHLPNSPLPTHGPFPLFSKHILVLSFWPFTFSFSLGFWPFKFESSFQQPL